MKKITQVDLGDYFKTPNPGLRAYLNHVVQGNSDVYRTPFWEGEEPKKVLESWSDEFLACHVDSKMPGLEAYELEMRGKVGPLSVQLPLSERIGSIEQYYSAITAKSQPIDARAIKAFCRTLVPVKGLTRRSQSNTVKSMRLSTNSGSPYFIKRRLAVQDTLPILGVHSDADGFSQQYLRDGTIAYGSCAVLGWRGQEGGPEVDDVKQRVVWMFPFAVNIMELTWYQPAIEAWQKAGINSAYQNMRAVEVKLTKLFDTKGDDLVVVTDFSKFDQHFNSDLQSAAKECMMFMSDMSNADGLSTKWWFENVFPVKYNIPLLCSDSLLYEGPHGMGSGSGGTNFDECCGHGCMQHEAAILKGTTLNPYSNAYGDDGYLSYKGIDVDDVISAYMSHGQELNPDKQSADKHSAVYLRRYFHDSYRDHEGIMLGVYSTFRALGRLLYQERYYDPEIWNGELVTLRALSILENCKNSPVFHQFVDFVAKGDKYGLGARKSGYLDRLGRLVKKSTDIMPDFLGYTKSLQGGSGGIENWAVVKYLKSKM